jgi:hypothetical protein
VEGLLELLVLEELAWWIFVFTYWCAEEACEKPLKSTYADEWAGSFDQRLWATERKLLLVAITRCAKVVRLFSGACF